MKPLSLQRLSLYMKLILIALAISLAPFSLAHVSPATAGIPLSQQNYLPFISKYNQANWLQFNGDASHSGNNPLETSLSVDSVGQLGLLFQVQLPGIADGAPVYLSTVSTPSGVRDLIFVTTRQGHITALDAHTGELVWTRQYAANGCLVNKNPTRNEACYTTSSPVIDPDRKYVYSYGLDGYVHKYAVGDGSEVQTGGWPELTTLKPYDEKGSSALSLATAANGINYLYVVHAGYPGDRGDYQGHLTAINLADGTQKVFNTLCSTQDVHFVDSRTVSGPDCYPETMAAIWARPGVVYDPFHDRILISTGNGTFQPSNFLWGDTVFSLNPDGSGLGGNPLDSYTPLDYQHLEDFDLDLGSTAPAILPLAKGKYAHLAVQGGKDGVLRLLNLDQLSGQSGTGHIGGEVFSISVPMGGRILTQPAVWTNLADGSTWVFVSDGNGLAAFQLVISAAGDPSLVVKWTSAGGTSPLVANGVLYIARSGQIRALKAADGSLLWASTSIGTIHWESPLVFHGVLYISDESGNLTAFSLP